MKIEKLNENKIRIILNNQDLIDKHVDYNAFMSNSAEAQDLYLCMLEEAEEKIGFVTKDYKIKIEALAMDSGDFIVIVTRFNEDQKSTSSVKNRKITARRKSSIPHSECLIYSFNTFDDVCNFSNYISNFDKLSTIAKSVVLHTYNSKYYLVLSKLNTEHPNIKNFYTLVTEFGTYVNNPDLFAHKLTERGNVLIKNNAIKTCAKYFCNK